MTERLDTPCFNSNPRPTLNEFWRASTEVAAGDRLPYRRTVNSRPKSGNSQCGNAGVQPDIHELL